MRRTHRTKVTAGVGLATMLLGALLVLVPVTAQASNEQAGNPSCAAILTPLGFTDIGEAKFEQGTDTVAPYPSSDPTEYATATGAFTVKFRLDSDGVRFKDSTAPIYAVAVKKGSANQDMSVLEPFAGVLSGFVAYTEGSFSNVKFCTGTPPTTGTADLTVEKQVDEEAPTSEAFDFTGPEGAFELADDDTESFTDLTPGVYQVSEVDLPDGYRLDDISCYEGTGQEAVEFEAYTVAQPKVTVTLAAGDDVTCVFTNVPTGGPTPAADLTVLKLISPTPAEGATTPAFAFTGPEGAFSLSHGDLEEIADLTPDTYQVTETEATGYDLSSVLCYELYGTDGQTSFPRTLVAGGMTVALEDGDDVTCVFTNVPETPYIPPVTVPPTPELASLTVDKDVTGDVPDGWEFTFGTEGPGTDELFTLDEGDDDESLELVAGTYELTEFEVPNDRATLVDVECVDDDDDAVGTVDDGVVTLVLTAGDDVTCTFTNDFAEVAPSEVATTTTTTTTTTVAPATTATTAAPAAVMGETITRLPRTGTHTGELAALGVLLIGLGAGLVLYERRRTAAQG